MVHICSGLLDSWLYKCSFFTYESDGFILSGYFMKEYVLNDLWFKESRNLHRLIYCGLAAILMMPLSFFQESNYEEAY